MPQEERVFADLMGQWDIISLIDGRDPVPYVMNFLTTFTDANISGTPREFVLERGGETLLIKLLGAWSFNALMGSTSEITFTGHAEVHGVTTTISCQVYAFEAVSLENDKPLGKIMLHGKAQQQG